MKNWMISIAFSFLSLLSVTSVFALENQEKGDADKTIDNNKHLILRLFTEVFNERNMAVIDELYAPDVVDHSAFPDQPPGRAGIHSAISGFFKAFDSLQIKVEDVVAEGDKVVTRETWKVFDASSKENPTGSVIHIFRISDGKITDEWSKGWGWLE